MRSRIVSKIEDVLGLRRTSGMAPSPSEEYNSAYPSCDDVDLFEALRQGIAFASVYEQGGVIRAWADHWSWVVEGREPEGVSYVDRTIALKRVRSLIADPGTKTMDQIMGDVLVALAVINEELDKDVVDEEE
jgi:hypothetical protein